MDVSEKLKQAGYSEVKLDSCAVCKNHAISDEKTFVCTENGCDIVHPLGFCGKFIEDIEFEPFEHISITECLNGRT